MKKTTIFVSATVATLSIITCMGFAAASGIQGDNLNAHAIAEELVFTKENFTNKFITNGVGYEINFDVQGETNPDTTGMLGLNEGASFFNTTKITGINCITVSFTGNLKIGYGYNKIAEETFDNRVMTHKGVELKNNVPFVFSDEFAPSYFELLAKDACTINSLKVTYSCKEILLPAAAQKEVYLVGNIGGQDVQTPVELSTSNNRGFFQHFISAKLNKGDVFYLTDDLESKTILAGYSTFVKGNKNVVGKLLVNADADKIKVEQTAIYDIYYKSTNDVWVEAKAEKAITEYYFVPGKAWLADKARFAAYFFNNASGKNIWVDMEQIVAIEGQETFKVKVPEGKWEQMIFCRMNPTTIENNWNTKWNQTYNLNLMQFDNCLTLSGSMDNTTYTWSNYVPTVSK